MTTITHPFHVPAAPRHLGATVTGVALLAGAVVGIVSWSHQLAGGLAETGLNGVVPWGLYTVLFTFFVSASAGALGLACAGLLLPSGTLADQVRPAAGVAVAGGVAAALTVVVNLTHPERAANLLLHPNWSAPFVWQLYGLLVALVVAGVLLALSRRVVRPFVSRVVAVAGLLLALGLPLLSAWVFTIPLGQATWDDPLLAPTLLASSATAGVALAALASTRERLSTLLVVALATTSLFTVLGYVTALTSGAKERALVEVVLPGGSWQWVFWTQWVATIVATALLVVPRLRRARVASAVAAAAGVVVVLALGTALLPASSTRPPIAAPPGTATGRWAADAASFVQIGSYRPTWVEYGVGLGLVAVFLAVLLLAHRRESGRGRA